VIRHCRFQPTCRWNVGYSLCNEASHNGFFINDQFHVHNTLRSGFCDRGQSVSRARVPLALNGNATRRIVFDFDGQRRRDFWYLEILPVKVDLIGQVAAFGGERGTPAHGLRLQQGDQRLTFKRIEPHGDTVAIADTNHQPWPSLEWAGRELIANVRRHWEVRVSRTAAEVWIDGQRVLATPPGALTLNEGAYHVYWNTFSYNTTKANHPTVLAHWDNFGFDAPSDASAPPVIHSYRLRNSGSDEIRSARDEATIGFPSVSLAIPDSIEGATTRRLRFTLQMWEYQSYAWTAQDRVLINGTAVALPRPDGYGVTPALPLTDIVSGNRPFAVELDVPLGVFRTGANTLRFELEKSGIHGIHAEFAFSPGTAPSYTPPSAHALGPAQPAVIRIGPNVKVRAIGSIPINSDESHNDDPAQFNPTVGGVIEIPVDVDNAVAQSGQGLNHGVREVVLVINGAIAERIATNATVAAPSAKVRFTVDTRTLANRRHQFFVYACDGEGDPSLTDFGGHNEQSGRYYPLHVTTQNPGQPSLPPVSASFDATTACRDALFSSGFDTG
jgi:hypothetical protein